MEDNQPDQPLSTNDLPSQRWKPLLAVGVILLSAALAWNQPASQAQSGESVAGSGTFRDVAFLGGIKRNNDFTTFRGGEATAVMGGIDIDLRNATMEGRESTLDVSSVMGGVKVRVPETWTVVSQVDTMLGGFEDRTRHPREEKFRLILKGSVVMGGLKITN